MHVRHISKVCHFLFMLPVPLLRLLCATHFRATKMYAHRWGNRNEKLKGIRTLNPSVRFYLSALHLDLSRKLTQKLQLSSHIMLGTYARAKHYLLNASRLAPIRWIFVCLFVCSCRWKDVHVRWFDVLYSTKKLCTRQNDEWKCGAIRVVSPLASHRAHWSKPRSICVRTICKSWIQWTNYIDTVSVVCFRHSAILFHPHWFHEQMVSADAATIRDPPQFKFMRRRYSTCASRFVEKTHVKAAQSPPPSPINSWKMKNHAARRKVSAIKRTAWHKKSVKIRPISWSDKCMWVRDAYTQLIIFLFILFPNV